MSYLQYGAVTIDIVDLQAWKREAIYSGNHYLFTRHIIAIRGTIGRTEHTYSLAANGGGIVEQGPANAQDAITTNAAMQHTLMQPRQSFKYVLKQGNQAAPNELILLQSPETGKDFDESYGPKPLECNVVDLYGPGSMAVDFIIQVDQNECDAHNGAASGHPVVLANIWTMEEDQDQDFFLTRIIKGQVRFSARGLADQFGNLGAAGHRVAADQYRDQILHELPHGWKREQAQVRTSEDGLTQEYQIVDRERAISIIPLYVTRLEAIHRLRVSTPGLTGGLGNIGNALMTGPAKTAVGTPDNPAPASDAAFGNLSAFVPNLVNAFVPITTHEFSIKVWGSPTSRREQLEKVASTIVVERLKKFGVGTSSIGMDVVITHDLVGRYIELTYMQLTGVLKDIANQWFGETKRGINFDGAQSSVFGDNEGVVGILTRDARPQTKGDQLRARHPYSLVTQEVRDDDCEQPWQGSVTNNVAKYPWYRKSAPKGVLS